MNNEIIGFAFIGVVAVAAGTCIWFRQQIDRATNELYTVLKNDVDIAVTEVKNHVQHFGAATRDEVSRLAKTDYADVLKARNDFIELAKGLHAKIDGIESKTHDAVHAAAKATLTAARRTCAFCNRVVHAFEVEAGIVKCTDCKAQGR